MDLRQLKYFVRIAELGSLSKAATALRIAQPALSKHVANLEAEFGQEFLLRTGRGMALTAAGRELLRHAHVMLRAAADATAALTQYAGSPGGSVAVGFTHSLAGALGQVLTEQVLHRYPGVRLSLFGELSGTLADNLKLGRVDIAVLFDINDLSGLHWQPVMQETMWLAVKPDSPWARHATITWPLLAQIPLVTSAITSGTQVLLEESLGRHGLQHKALVEVNSLEISKEIVKSGLAASLMPANCIEHEVARGEIKLIEVESGAITRRVMVCRTLAGTHSESSRLIFDLLVDQIRRQAASGQWPGCRALDAQDK